MTKTTNYQLNQWAKSDRIMMDDFNADNAKIDAALKANADAMPRILHGSYTGDGAESRKIDLGFTPKAVYVRPSKGGIYYGSGMTQQQNGGLATATAPVSLTAYNGTSNPVLTVTAGGFMVYYRELQVNSNTYTAASNANGTVMHYLAIG